MTKWRPARQWLQFQNYPLAVSARSSIEALDVEDTKGRRVMPVLDMSLVWLRRTGRLLLTITSAVLRGLGDRSGVKSSTWKLQNRREPCCRHVCCPPGHKWWSSLLTHRHWQRFFPLLYTISTIQRQSAAEQNANASSREIIFMWSVPRNYAG
jgi:hypothetical protein